MSPHLKSAHREDAVRHAAALEEGVCLVLDALLELGEVTAYQRAFALLFIPRPTSPAATDPAPRPDPL